tara:strand:+ start:3901 stop:4440 length:540 start_codon:yes stop_codon:yes gene_type:complete
MTIYQKLAKIQTKFKSKKSRFNSFGKYYFRSAEDILEAIKPFNDELGIAVTINEELIATEPMPIIQSTARLTDDKGMELTAVAIVGVDLNQKGMQTPQQFGSASSYAKKYALGNLLLIDDTQDSDATNNHGKAASKKTKQILSDVTKAIDYLKAGGKLESIKAKYDLTPGQLSTLSKAV